MTMTKEQEADQELLKEATEIRNKLPPEAQKQLSEGEADSTANPYGEESLRDIIKDLMSSFENLHAKSILNEKEATTFANLASFAFYHKTPSLLRWVNKQLEYRMSINGQRVRDVMGPFGGAVENSKKKSLKDRIVEIS